MANQKIKANLIPSYDMINPVIHLAQYDVSDGTGKQVEIELYYGSDKYTIPSGSTVTFRGTKIDNTGYSYEITKFTDNVVTVDVKPQMTVLSGTHNAELRISKGNMISNTIKFVMDIDSSALADDTKVSETQLPTIEKASQAYDFCVSVQDKVEEAKASAESAIQTKAEVEQLKASVEKSEKNAKQSETNASNSAKEAKASADSVENVVSDVSKLKEDLSNKITKFYASNQGETHITDSDNGKIQDMMIYGMSSQFTTTGKNLSNGQNIHCFINSTTNVCGVTDNDNGMAIDVSKLTNVTISTRGIQDRYRAGCTDTVPINGMQVTCYNGIIKDGTKDSYTIDTTDYNYLIVNATKLEDIQVEKGSEATSYEPYTGGAPSPSPDYPQEIKSVVNPTVKLLGSNILKIADGEYQDGGVTVTVSNGVVKLKGTANRYLDIPLTANGENFFKEGTKIIFSPNNVKGIENKNGSYLDFSNNNTIGFSITNENINKPYIIKERDTKNSFILFIRCSAGENYDETWKPQVLIGKTITPFKPYTKQTIKLPITLNAIPVSSGGNVTINGQQYIADYVDVEHGKLVKMVDSSKLDNTQSIIDKTEWLLAEPQEIDLTAEQTQAFKVLATYYPTTNIFINSEQLDGYTVFNYPISMANGWNYVKQQLNDNRDYIYDMDLQSAEAYVNSEYAVALTELGV